MTRTTLDIIGLAGNLSCLSSHRCYLTVTSSGFNYNFNALTNDPEANELMKSFSALFKAGQSPSIIPLLETVYPLLRFLVRISVSARPLLPSNLYGLIASTKRSCEHEV